jgi:glycosyltransferase involved in cell wall biosynthesis
VAADLRVVLTTPSFPPFNSGLGNAVQQQAGALAQQGVEVVVATGGERRQRRIDPHSGAAVEEFTVTGADYLLHPIRGDAQGYVDFLAQAKADVLVMHAWQNWATDLVLRNAQNIGGKKFLVSHCISTNIFFPVQPLRSAARYLLWRPYWWSLAEKIRKLDGIIFLAEEGSDSRFADARLAHGIAIDKHVIPNSLSEPALQALAWPAPALAQRRQLIAVGNYQWQKGFDFVLRAYAGSAVKNKWPLKFFGQRHTGFSGRLHALAERLGLDRNLVSFNEGVAGENLLQEYAQSALFLSGSHTECQPLVLLDANAAGTPFIARATGCIASMPGGVAVATPEQAATQIDRLLADQDRWAQLSGRGRAAAADIYHPRHTTPLLMQALFGSAQPSAKPA